MVLMSMAHKASRQIRKAYSAFPQLIPELLDRESCFQEKRRYTIRLKEIGIAPR
jgi:hypothetical protein